MWISHPRHPCWRRWWMTLVVVTTLQVITPIYCQGWTALHQAAANGHDNTVKVLLDAGADINAVDNKGWTSLHQAAANGHDNTVKVLLDAGADINAVDNKDWTALHQAAANGHDNTVKVLLDAGADINAVDNKGWTALHQAAANGHDNTVKVLLDAGADVNAVDNKGWTALDQAAEDGHNNTVKVLLDAGADINAVDIEGCNISEAYGSLMSICGGLDTYYWWPGQDVTKITLQLPGRNKTIQVNSSHQQQWHKVTVTDDGVMKDKTATRSDKNYSVIIPTLSVAEVIDCADETKTDLRVASNEKMFWARNCANVPSECPDKTGVKCSTPSPLPRPAAPGQEWWIYLVTVLALTLLFGLLNFIVIKCMRLQKSRVSDSPQNHPGHRESDLHLEPLPGSRQSDLYLEPLPGSRQSDLYLEPLPRPRQSVLEHVYDEIDEQTLTVIQSRCNNHTQATSDISERIKALERACCELASRYTEMQKMITELPGLLNITDSLKESSPV